VAAPIELWNNLNGVDATDGQNYGELDYLGAQDGFYQDVKTVAGQSYDLSFDARSRPGFTSFDHLHGDLVERFSRCHRPPGASWQTTIFTVVGTGGQDRLTFRELAGQGGDGLGALYDNVSLTAKSTNATSAVTLASADHSIDLMKQYAATSFASTSTGLKYCRHPARQPQFIGPDARFAAALDRQSVMIADEQRRRRWRRPLLRLRRWQATIARRNRRTPRVDRGKIDNRQLRPA